MSKIEVNKQQKQQSLLDSAFHLFIENGFAETSISDIVKRAGVAKGTFYLYFKDKPDILNRLTTAKARQVFQIAYAHLKEEQALEEDSEVLSGFEDQIIFIINDVLDQLADNKTLLLLLSKNLGWGLFREAVLYKEGEIDYPVPSLLDQLVKASGYIYEQPETMLYLIVELISGTAYNAILMSQPMSLDELKAPLFEAVRAIMRSFRIEKES